MLCLSRNTPNKLAHSKGQRKIFSPLMYENATSVVHHSQHPWSQRGALPRVSSSERRGASRSWAHQSHSYLGNWICRPSQDLFFSFIIYIPSTLPQPHPTLGLLWLRKFNTKCYPSPYHIVLQYQHFKYYFLHMLCFFSSNCLWTLGNSINFIWGVLLVPYNLSMTFEQSSGSKPISTSCFSATVIWFRDRHISPSWSQQDGRKLLWNFL